MSYLSDFEHTKLDAHVYPGIVVQTYYVSDSISGQRRVPKTKIWNVERLLGKGGFGEVRLEVHNEEQRAVKRIWATGSTFKVEYERELKALLEFSKPKYKESAVFVEFFGWFEDPDSVYLAMEFVPLGDLEENVKARGGAIEEAEVKEITVQVLEGLNIMHLESFVHRDLKPKNILVCRGPPKWWIKLADFGLSKRRTEDTAFRTQTGTQAYMAPEILNYIPGHSEYTNAVDMWALGCIVYRLASGVVPFPPGLSLTAFCGNESMFPSQSLSLSEVGVEFVRSLIVPHPSRRLTAQQALGHAWSKIESADQNSEPLGTEINISGTSLPSSFGGYNTASHAGLQSYGSHISGLSDEIGRRAKDGINYHPPTVEDDPEEVIEAHGRNERMAEDSSGGDTGLHVHGTPRKTSETEDQNFTIKYKTRNSKYDDNIRTVRGPKAISKETTATKDIEVREATLQPENQNPFDYEKGQETQRSKERARQAKPVEDEHKSPVDSPSERSGKASTRHRRPKAEVEHRTGQYQAHGRRVGQALSDYYSGTDTGSESDYPNPRPSYFEEVRYNTAYSPEDVVYSPRPSRNAPGAIRYIIENGRTVPTHSKSTKYVVENGRTVPIRSSFQRESPVSTDGAQGGSSHPFHQQPPYGGNGVPEEMSHETWNDFEDWRWLGPLTYRQPVPSVETHSEAGATRASRRSRSPSRQPSLSPGPSRPKSHDYLRRSSERHDQPTYFADEHGFIDTKSPTFADTKTGETDHKVRSRKPYVEDFSSGDEDFGNRRLKMEKEERIGEKAFSAVPAEAAARHVQTQRGSVKEVPINEKWSEHRDFAAIYMQAARRKQFPPPEIPEMRRAETFSASAPPTYNIRYAAPQLQNSDDDTPRRSSARLEVPTQPQTARAETFASPSYNIRYAAPQPQNSDDDTPRRSSARLEVPTQPQTARAETFASPVYNIRYAAPQRYSDDERPKSSSAMHPTQNSSEKQTTRRKKSSRRRSSPPSKIQDSSRREMIPPLPRAETFQRGDTQDDPLNEAAKDYPSIETIPEGWQPTWNDQYSEWFYVNIYTKQFQWDKPSEPVYPPSVKAPLLPRARTFQSGDRQRSSKSKNVEYTSSDSESDSPRGQPHRSEPTRYIVENGRSVPATPRRRRDPREFVYT